ncbi:MAG TPA: hypothetical protein VNT03_04510 [Baekduia sp.]|nr:hypothetical protein [Baekduia sp.]
MLTPNVHEITPQAIAAGLIATGQRPSVHIVTERKLHDAPRP